MGWNDHLNNDFDYVDSCPKCGKKFKVSTTEQIPGFRAREYLYCPYCGTEVRSSMECEFSSYKMED